MWYKKLKLQNEISQKKISQNKSKNENDTKKKAKQGQSKYIMILSYKINKR